MKMAAGNLLGRSAGMKNMGAFLSFQTGKLQFLEGARRQGRNLVPMPDVIGGNISAFAKSPIRNYG